MGAVALRLRMVIRGTIVTYVIFVGPVSCNYSMGTVVVQPGNWYGFLIGICLSFLIQNLPAKESRCIPRGRQEKKRKTAIETGRLCDKRRRE